MEERLNDLLNSLHGRALGSVQNSWLSAHLHQQQLQASEIHT